MGVIWGVLKYLEYYTEHSFSTIVPDLSGYDIAEVDSILEEYDLKYMILDSAYSVQAKRGSIYEQEPKPGGKVKRNRTIYLYIYASTTQKVNMPKVTSVAVRQAKAILESMKLNLGTISYIAHTHKGLVVHQLYDGKEIKPGTLIETDATIDIEVGQGVGDKNVLMPDFTGMPYTKVKQLLFQKILNLGLVIYDDIKNETYTDTIVYKQSPLYKEGVKLKEGSSIDLWVTTSVQYEKKLKKSGL